jgi:hypothetical protein
LENDIKFSKAESGAGVELLPDLDLTFHVGWREAQSLEYGFHHAPVAQIGRMYEKFNSAFEFFVGKIFHF